MIPTYWLWVLIPLGAVVALGVEWVIKFWQENIKDRL